MKVSTPFFALPRSAAPAQALSEVLPAIAARKVGKGGYLVLRPDSGDPVEAVLMVRASWQLVTGGKRAEIAQAITIGSVAAVQRRAEASSEE